MKTPRDSATLVMLIVSFFFTSVSFAQTFPLKRTQTSAEGEITKQMQIAKESGDVNKLMQLQYELDKETGITVTKPGDYYPASVHPVQQNTPPFVTDNINITRISSLTGIRALATTIQQTGVAGSGGVLWTVAAVSNTSSNDTIYYYRSTDDGTSWALFGFISLGNSDEVNFDEMDVELLEDTGEKYLWTVFGVTGGNGKKFIAGVVSKTTTFSAGTFALAWPGENFSVTTYGNFKPRITSDNAKYLSTSSVYITASQDSTYNSGVHAGSVKTVKCGNPFTISPVFTYSTMLIVNIVNSHNADPTALHTDIAYFHRNGDSLAVITSNLNGITFIPPTLIVYAVCNTAFTQAGYITSTDGGAAYNKEFARIAANGGTNQRDIMIIYREDYQNSGDWDIKTLYSSNAGTSFVTQNIDVRRSTTNIPLPPDIVGRRNSAGKFFAAYTYSTSSFDTVKYCATYPSGGVNWGNLLTMNHLSSYQRPKPGFRFVDSDTCYVIWATRSNSLNSEVWSSGGCSGTMTIGIQNINSEIPKTYKLEQNYPNPFNPVTNIKFAVPKAGYVNVTVFDISGREAAVLVNDELTAGTYNVDFDAGNFSSGAYFYRITAGEFTSVKKMVLVK